MTGSFMDERFTAGPTYVLLMNDMRGPKFEIREPVAIGSYEEIEQLLSAERVELYQDGGFAKCYRRGGPLEWYNVVGHEVELWHPKTPPQAKDLLEHVTRRMRGGTPP